MGLKHYETSTMRLDEIGPIDAPGEFRMIHKDRLTIPTDSYQREAENEGGIRIMARDWSWALCGALHVVERDDGLLPVFDGGRRLRAARRRPDIAEVPCMVYRLATVSMEARAFIDKQTKIARVKPYNVHVAGVVAGVPVDIAASDIVAANGYAVTRGDADHGFEAIGTLRKMISQDEPLARRVFSTLAAVADGGGIPGVVLEGLFVLAKKQAPEHDVLIGKWLRKMHLVGIDGLTAAVRKHTLRVGQGGALTAAAGICMALNDNMKKLRLPMNRLNSAE